MIRSIIDSRILRVVGLLFIISGLNIPIFAAETGRIAGTIMDSESGWLLPKTEITIKGIEKVSLSDQDGFYYFVDIPTGEYDLTAFCDGYKLIKMSNVRVWTDSTTVVNFKLTKVSIPPVEGTGKIAGTVRDSEIGHLMPQVVIALQGTDREAFSDQDGFYFLLNIPPGRHDVTAKREGYEDLTIPGVQVTVDRTTTVHFQMKQSVVDLQKTGLPWPVQGMMTSGEVKRKEDKSPRNILEGSMSLSVLAVEGSDVRAVAAGTVEKVEADSPYYRNFVAIRHPEGYRSLYANTGKNMVRVGEKVRAGKVIATVGRHSLDEPAFLGFSMSKGEVGEFYIDAKAYLTEDGRYENPRVLINTSLWSGQPAETGKTEPEFPIVQSYWELSDRFRAEKLEEVFRVDDLAFVDGATFFANRGQTLRYSTELTHYDGVTLEITPEKGIEEMIPLVIRMSRNGSQLLSTRLVAKEDRSYVLGGRYPGGDDSFFLIVTPRIVDIPALGSIPGETDSESPPPAFVAYDTAPELIYKVVPEYPELAKEAGVTGTVWLSLWVTKEGNVHKARFMRGPEVFRETATDAALKMKFSPAKKEGHPVAVWVSLPFKFFLEDKEK